MSVKKNAAAETSGKVMTSYDKKMQKKKEQEALAKKEERKNKFLSLAVVLVVVAFFAYFPISTFVATTSTYAQVGEEDITKVEFDYYYNFSLISFVNQNSYLLSYIGLDTSKPLNQQMYGQYMTWDDYFQQTAMTNLLQTKSLVAEAKAKGFEHDTTAEVDAHIAAFATTAANEGLTLKDYISVYYGEYATEKRIRPILAESYYANAYYEAVYAGLDITEEEILAYYEEGVNNYDSVDFKLITVDAEIPQGETTVDEEGNATVADPTEEQIAEAMAAAKEKADKQLLFVTADGEVQTNVKYANANYYYASWLFDAERKAGDTTVVEDMGNHRYYVVSFTDRYLDDTKAVSARIIMTTADNSEAIKAEFEAKGSTEEAFISLVEKYSEDSYTNLDGGLYEEISATGLSEEIGDWLLGDRAYGDFFTGVGSDGYNYAMFFVGHGREEWKVSIDSTLRSTEMSMYLLELTNGVEIIDTKGKLTYIENKEKENAAAESTTEE